MACLFENMTRRCKVLMFSDREMYVIISTLLPIFANVQELPRWLTRDILNNLERTPLGVFWRSGYASSSSSEARKRKNQSPCHYQCHYLHAIIQLLVPTKTSFVVECLFEFGDLKITFINNCVEQTV